MSRSIFSEFSVSDGSPALMEGGFNPIDYLPDVVPFIEVNTPGNYPPDPEKFSQKSLQEHPGMEWLADVHCELIYPESDSPDTQKVQLRDWLDGLRGSMCYMTRDICELFPENMREPILALDLETTSLDTRVKYDRQGNLIKNVQIVGLCLAVNSDLGFYLPVRNTEEDGIPNWNPQVIIDFIGHLHMTFCCVYHNSQYDLEVCSLEGINQFRPWPYFQDTQLIAYLADVNRKGNGLKLLSEKQLGRKMIEIHELFGEKSKSDTFVNFDKLPATTAYVYGASDAMNTFGLLMHHCASSNSPLKRQPVATKIDHEMVLPLRTLYRQGFPVNLKYMIRAAMDAIIRVHTIEHRIYEVVGRQFNIGSSTQLNQILFKEFGIQPLKGEEPNKKGEFSLSEEKLDKLYEKNPDVFILQAIVKFRKLQNTLSKLYIKAVINSYTCYLMPYAKVQIQFSQTTVPTGRFSSSSSGGIPHRVVVKENKKSLGYKYTKESGDAGFNTQGINSKPPYWPGKVRKVNRLPLESGIDVDNPYPEKVRVDYIKAVAMCKRGG